MVSRCAEFRNATGGETDSVLVLPVDSGHRVPAHQNPLLSTFHVFGQSWDRARGSDEIVRALKNNWQRLRNETEESVGRRDSEFVTRSLGRPTIRTTSSAPQSNRQTRHASRPAFDHPESAPLSRRTLWPHRGIGNRFLYTPTIAFAKALIHASPLCKRSYIDRFRERALAPSRRIAEKRAAPSSP
jgi:hypothetical protein